MIYDITAIIIGLAALIIIFRILFKKFPVLSAIDTDKVPQEKENKLKNGLIEERLKRKATHAGEKIKDNLGPIYNKYEGKARKWYHKILEAEKKYREKTKKQKPVTLEAKDEQAQKISVMLREAEELRNKEYFKEAESQCIEIISLDPKNIEAYHLLGDLYIELRDYDHAKEIFSFLIKCNSEDDRALSGLGHIASSVGNLKEAKEDFLASINLNNKIATYHLDLAKVCQAMGDSKEAIDCCQEALRLEPKHPKHLNSLLQICIETKNKGMAIRTLDRLSEVNPENQKLKELKKQVDAL